MCSRATGTGLLTADSGQRARVDRELGGVEGLDAGVLLAVERGHGRDLRAGLAAQGERQVGVVEPQAEVVLVGRRERGGAAERHGEGLAVEDAANRGPADAVAVGVDVGLVPRHAERLERLLDHEQVEVGVARRTEDGHLHQVVLRPGGDGGKAAEVRQAGLDAGRRHQAEGERVAVRGGRGAGDGAGTGGRKAKRHGQCGPGRGGAQPGPQ